MKVYKEVKKVIDDAKSIIIASHINPDGDAIGSTVALGQALKGMNKEVVMFNNDKVPDNLAFLNLSDEIVNKLPDKVFDAVMLVDCSSIDRAGKVFEKVKVKGSVITIDHHEINEPSINISCIDKSSASAGEVVLRLLQYLKVPILPAMAEAIYCTLVVDTGFFKYSNTTEKVLRVAADLVAAGADPWQVAKNLEESYTIARYRLLCMVLATLELSRDKKFASMHITQNMFDETGAKPEDTEEFSGIPRTIKNVEISALFREMPDKKIRVSLRSKGGADISIAARKFGGGGHPFAAGCTIVGTLDGAKEKMMRELGIK